MAFVGSLDSARAHLFMERWQTAQETVKMRALILVAAFTTHMIPHLVNVGCLIPVLHWMTPSVQNVLVEALDVT